MDNQLARGWTTSWPSNRKKVDNQLAHQHIYIYIYIYIYFFFFIEDLYFIKVRQCHDLHHKHSPSWLSPFGSLRIFNRGSGLWINKQVSRILGVAWGPLMTPLRLGVVILHVERPHIEQSECISCGLCWCWLFLSYPSSPSW